jgi:hypothetical protein
MTDHDPLCITVGLSEQERRDYLAYCVCDLIATVRADERRRMENRGMVSILHMEQALTDLRAKVEGLPEGGANKSRDAGRGYAQAIVDVLTLIDGSSK